MLLVCERMADAVEKRTLTGKAVPLKLAVGPGVLLTKPEPPMSWPVEKILAGLVSMR